jgi:hypothetical protein
VHVAFAPVGAMRSVDADEPCRLPPSASSTPHMAPAGGSMVKLIAAAATNPTAAALAITGISCTYPSPGSPSRSL